MPVFPSQDLYGKKICESYQQLLQIYDNDVVLDGSGSQKQFLNVTASYALNCNCASGSGTSLQTGSTYPITSSWSTYSTYATYSVTASYALNAGTLLQTGSYYPITSSWSEYAIYALNVPSPLQTGSTYPITSSWAEYSTISIYSLTSSYGIYAITASYALNCNCSSGSLYNSVTGSFVSSSTWIFTHNLQTRPVLVQAYDYSFNQIIPSSIVLINDNVATLTFPVSESGFAIATRSGLRTTISGSTSNCCLQTGSTYPITSSWALTASYALNGGGTGLYTGSTYPITASWALNVLNGGTSLYTGSYYPITSSWALTASYALNCNCGSGSLYNSVTGSFVSSSTWIFTHNLQTRPVLVQAYDYSFNQIIPSSIVLTNDNVATLTFPVSESGFAIATRSGLRTTISGSTSNCCLQTGSTYPITASWAINALNGGTTLHTGSTYPITSSWALNSNYAVTASYIGDSVTDTFISSSTWIFNHNLQARPVLIQAYDINYNQIVPQDIMLIDDNTALLAFPVMVSGFAIATRSGFRSVVTGTPMYTGSYYPITSSWAVNTQTSSYIQVTGVSYPVRRIYNNYTVVRTTDYTVLCDATNGEFNVKLPNPVGNTNIYNIKKIDTSGHRINVTVTNASFIDYELTQSIAHRGTNMMVQSDGTNQYWIL